MGFRQTQTVYVFFFEKCKTYEKKYVCFGSVQTNKNVCFLSLFWWQFILYCFQRTKHDFEFFGLGITIRKVQNGGSGSARFWLAPKFSETDDDRHAVVCKKSLFFYLQIPKPTDIVYIQRLSNFVYILWQTLYIYKKSAQPWKYYFCYKKCGF